MKCQNCNYNDAEVTVSVHFEEQEWSIHLCADCAQGMRQFAGAMLRGHRYGAAGAVDGEAETASAPPRTSGGEVRWEGDTVPVNAGEEIRQRRRLGELRALLEEAVADERYESAAALRDEISNLEKGVVTYDQ